MQPEEEKIDLPHHKQQTLCTTRLPYRQGRKLTAIKVYTVTKESNHLLIFGVPSLNLRQELKCHFIKFGKVIQFNISTKHASEQFTETYHAQYEKIQSARLAKRMLDTKNFYGGVLHVCYAPEFETITETRDKLIQRQKDVLFRIRNLQNDVNKVNKTEEIQVKVNTEPTKLNMGEVNTLIFGTNIKKRKKKSKKSNFEQLEKDNMVVYNQITTDVNISQENKSEVEARILDEAVGEGNSNIKQQNNSKFTKKFKSNIEDKNLELEDGISIIDCTRVDCELVTNINEHLNYNKFGNEDIRKIPPKPVNKICFNLNKK